MQKLCLIAALALLYFSNLSGTGFLGPDEPRYASIGREMARSGDWVTPRLDGQPWYEKSPLLYWTTATATKAGLTDEWAARLPVALISFAFLLFFYGTLEREFSRRVALTATAILGTSAGWAALSFVAVTDLPMSATLNAAILIALFGPQALGPRSTRGARNSSSDNRYRAQGWIAGALLGLAVLAKGFVPLVLIAPVFLVARGKRIRMILAMLAVAAPWYILCYRANGQAFIDDFWWKQQWGRFFTPDLEHVQPFWYYVPVLLAGLFPWTPLVALIGRRRSLPGAMDDERVRFLLFYLAFGFVFFSAAVNKLPGYILPLMPVMAIILAVSLDKARATAPWLTACALFLLAVPVIVDILPEAVDIGLTHVEWSAMPLSWMMLVPLAASVLTWWLAHNDAAQEWSDRRRWAALVVAFTTVACLGYLKYVTLPRFDESVSVRAFWRANADPALCLGDVKRPWIYGLNYYAGHPIAPCNENQRPRITTHSGGLVTR